MGPAELLQGLGPQAQGHPEAGRRGRRQPLGCQGVAPSQVGGAPTLWAGLKGQLILDELVQAEPFGTTHYSSSDQLSVALLLRSLACYAERAAADSP